MKGSERVMVGETFTKLRYIAPQEQFHVSSFNRQKPHGNSVFSNSIFVHVSNLCVLFALYLSTYVQTHAGWIFQPCCIRTTITQTDSCTLEGLCNQAASVLQQAINTESIIAPKGATGQGGQERHHPKGQCLERKQEGRGMTEAWGWKQWRQGGGCELPQTKWSVKQELFVTRKLFTGGGSSIFQWTGVCVSNKGYKLRKPPRPLV